VDFSGFGTLDWIFIVIMAIGALRGLQRGFVRELLGVFGTLLALGLAYFLMDVVGDLFARLISEGFWNQPLGFLLVFLILHGLIVFLQSLFKKALEQLKLEGFDKLMGVLLGIGEMSLLIGIFLWGIYSGIIPLEGLAADSVIAEWMQSYLPLSNGNPGAMNV
jgi:membrane protein required for colicin V production